LILNPDCTAIFARVPDARTSVSVAPNPFNTATNIRFNLSAPMSVNAAVYSVDGRLVRSLSREKPMPAGEQFLTWYGRDDSGRPVASGVYLVRISTRLGDRITRAVFLK
jgi:hypothetical protein